MEPTRITEAELRGMDASLAEADRFGDDDHGIDTARLVAEVRRLRGLILAAEPIVDFAADMAPCPVCGGDTDVPTHIASPASPVDLALEERNGAEVLVAKPKTGVWIPGRHSHHKPGCTLMAVLDEARHSRPDTAVLP